MLSKPIGSTGFNILLGQFFLVGSLLQLTGCSGLSLLNDPLQPQQSQVSNLAFPPQDNLAQASIKPGMADESDGDGEPSNGSEGPVPTVVELASIPVVGIDAAKTGQSLETDIASTKVDQAVKWRGKFDGASVDIANVDGTLCTGPTAFQPGITHGSGNITLACSDGRMAKLQISKGGLKGIVRLGGANENVQVMRND